MPWVNIYETKLLWFRIYYHWKEFSIHAVPHILVQAVFKIIFLLRSYCIVIVSVLAGGNRCVCLWPPAFVCGTLQMNIWSVMSYIDWHWSSVCELNSQEHTEKSVILLSLKYFLFQVLKHLQSHLLQSENNSHTINVLINCVSTKQKKVAAAETKLLVWGDALHRADIGKTCS